ncbi:MAG: hypothetical protein NPIRA02_16470 [Nitrospirales bacterium]|nr:MAG: hypothetical protein NPIRA02_16470 [Nitrospirales bacterium]
MHLDLKDKGICRSLILFGTREVDHKIILEKVLKHGMKVLDIGANIGYYVLMEQRLIGPSGRIVAVEPSPSNITLLKRNIELNDYGSIEVIQGAVSDVSGTRKFYLSEESNLNTFHAIGTIQKHLSGEMIHVTTYTVPELAQAYGSPDLIRMDVEGHEVEIMAGMLDAIAKGTMTPMIIFETHNSRYSDSHDMKSVLRAFFKLRYSIRYLASSAQNGTQRIKQRGYHGGAPISTDGVTRVIFENVKEEDGLEFICHGGARTVLLQYS